MSYDLMVFDTNAAPRSGSEFTAWYDQITEWNEGLDYNDPANLSPALRACYKDMIGAFPAMNGPDQTDDFDSSYVSDYTCARSVVYVAFAWSVAELAHNMLVQLAEKHGVGFFDVSGNSDVFGPTVEGFGRWFTAGND
jgi:hypothetical protein